MRLHETVSLGIIAYSPDQPRDSNGRWGSGDSGYKAPSHAEQTEAIDYTKQYLGQILQLTGGRGTDAFVAQHGKPYYFNDKSFDGPRGTPKQCYMNAFHAAMDDPRLTYVEGYVHIGILPIHHAWTVDRQGNVHDPTLRKEFGTGRVKTMGYFGVPFNRDYVMKTAVRTKVYGVLSYTNPQLFDVTDTKGIVASWYRGVVAYSPDEPSRSRSTD